MRIDLPYGLGEIPVHVQDENCAGILRLGETGSMHMGASEIRAAVEPGLRAFISLPGSPLVVINDATRATPTSVVLDAMGDVLEASGARFIVATGTHRPPTEKEFGFIFGKWLNKFRDRVLVHDCRDMERMADLGTTSFGTRLYLNRAIVEAEKILVIGSVEPHFFAGYSGGRKAFLPGTAAYCSIEHNHKMALCNDAKVFKLKGNPVHEDMVEASLRVTVPVYSIMTILDRDLNVAKVCAGDLQRAFDLAVMEVDKVYTVPLKEAADVVVAASPYPLDIDLYQSQKALDNARLAVKDGGTIILVSQCRDGLGGKAFVDLMSSADTPDGVMERIDAGFKVGYQRAAKLVETIGHARVLVYSDLDDCKVRMLFMEPVHDLQRAIDDAILRHGKDCRILFMPEASITVPKPSWLQKY